MRFRVLARRSSRCIIRVRLRAQALRILQQSDLAGQQRDLASCGSAARRGDILRVFKRMPCSVTNLPKRSRYFARIASHGADFRQFLTVCLADVEDVGRAESDSR
jgi:hypothetical protein